MAQTSEQSGADRLSSIIGRSGLIGRFKSFLTRRMSQWLAHQYLPFALTAVSMLLALPSLWSGFALDDYFHKMAIQGWPIHLFPQGLPDLEKLAGPSLNIFSFLRGGPLRIRYLIEKGFVPWWTLESVKLDFWRPVSALTHWLDYQLWPNSSLAMHMHSLLWLGIATIIITLFYQRIIGPRLISAPWVAGLAALLYTIDDAHAIPVSWLANRNTLIALFFGAAAIILHDKWRRDRSLQNQRSQNQRPQNQRPQDQRPQDQRSQEQNQRYRIPAAALLAPLCLAVALLAKEEAITICGYLFAYALFLDQDLWRKRAASMVPYALIVVIWRIIYRAAGHGVWGIAWYIDPLLSPRQFMSNLHIRATKLLLGQFALVEADPLGIIVMRPWAVALLIVFFLIALVYLFRDRLAWFWFTGMMLAVIPVCTSLPSERMLFFIGLGAMGLLAQLFFALSKSLRPVNASSRNAFTHQSASGSAARHAMACLRRALVYGFCFILIILHLVLAPLLWPLKIYGFSAWSRNIDHTIETAPLDDMVSHKTVVVVNATVFYPVYLPIFRSLKGQSSPQYIRSLASAFGSSVPIRISRSDERTLTVEPEGGFIWTFFRDRSNPLSIGSRVVLPGMTAEVMKLNQEGWPQEVRYRFSSPLEDPSLVWLQIQNHTSVPFTLPAIGETLVLSSEGR